MVQWFSYFSSLTTAPFYTAGVKTILGAERMRWKLCFLNGNWLFHHITSLPLSLYGLSIITIRLCIMPNHALHHHHLRFICWALTPSLMLHHHHHHHHHYGLCMINTVRLWIMHLYHNIHQLIVLCINLAEHHHHLCFIFVIMFHFCEEMTEISF